VFWSKLWLFLVTLAGCLAVAVAMLAPRSLQRDVERESAARLERAQHDASLLLKVNARKWMDTAAQVATDAVLVEALEQATRGPADLGLVHKTVQERLRYFNDKMKVDLVIACDAKGRVIARAGLDEAVYKDGVEGFPLISDALRGLRGDDTWSLDGKLYRVAASPVIARERYAGALVVGQEVGGELAQSMRQVLDVDVAFLLRGRVLASSSQLPILTKLPTVVDQQQAEIARNGHSAAVPVDAGDKSFLACVAPFAGEAAAHKASYVLLLPRSASVALPAMIKDLLQTDPHTLPWMTLAPVGGALLVLLVLGILLMRLEADRPLKRMAREAQALARGEIHRLDDDRHPGKLGTIARAVNTMLDRLGSQKSAPIAVRDPRPTPPAIASQPPMLIPEPPPRKPPPPSMPYLEVVPPPRHEEPTPILESEQAAELLARSAQPVLAIGGSMEGEVTHPKASLHSLSESTDQVTMPAMPHNDGPDMVSAPQSLLGPLSVPPPIPAPTPPGARRIQTPRPSSFGDEDPTHAADPEQMRALIADAKAAPSEPSVIDPATAALTAELEQVFHDFLETKQRLGEPTENVTYEKFVSKLRQNREQLITKYNCKTVKFQVYVKDGKAALKATPVH
jgi:hypothetical protein